MEIKNLKTSKTEKQIQDEINAVKAKRKTQLSQTDWTQLDDVNLQNSEEFRNWRKALRELNITSLKDKSLLDDLIINKPVPRVSKEIPTQEDKDISVKECIVEDRVDAEKCLTSLLIEEKNSELVEADASSYPLFRLLQEELIEHDLGQTPPKFLSRYMGAVGLDPQATEDLKEVEEICKNFFATVNEIFFTFECKIRSVYTMSEEELDQELNKRGYRYRPIN